MNPYETLFTPLMLKGVTIRNRIALAPMNTNLADSDGSVNHRFTRYYVERGMGGTGLLIVSSAYIDAAAKKRSGALLLDDDRFIPKLKRFTDAIHATGAKIFQQLNHNGRLLASSKELKTAVTTTVVGPSAIPHLSTGAIPKALTVADIRELIEKFGQAARRAKAAGFDGVELHGTHGYLINQFFSIYSNRRTDAYGGSLENRMRFPLEVYRWARELTGDDFLICYRVNAREFAPVETPMEDVIAFCRRLESEGVDLLHVSVGNSETPTGLLKMIPPGSAPLGCYADLAGEIKKAVKIPVIAVGRINTPEIAERILREGQADMVAIGRALIADPYWPEKAYQGEAERIRRCIGCNQGCIERLAQEDTVRCLCNPEVGEEGTQKTVAPKRKKVLVVGGGPAGMEAAITAASSGHVVELYEKQSNLGGQCLLAAASPGKEEFSTVIDFFVGELKRLAVPIHLNQEIRAGEIVNDPPDVVILATGSLPLIPEIPGIKTGIERGDVVTAWDVLKGRETGSNVAVIGGGLVGVETALFLNKKGKDVVLIEKLDTIGQDAGPLNRARLKDAIRETRIEVRCKTELLEIGDNTITVDCETGPYDIPTNTVVPAMGAEAQNTLLKDIEGKVHEVYAIGDCMETRNMIEAIHDAYDVTLKI